MSNELRTWIYYINAACTVFFALEAIVKIFINTPPVRPQAHMHDNAWHMHYTCIAHA